MSFVMVVVEQGPDRNRAFAFTLSIILLTQACAYNSTNQRFSIRAIGANKHLWLTNLNINTVVDIGAHEGEFAAKIRGILPTASILSFEPLPGPFTG